MSLFAKNMSGLQKNAAQQNMGFQVYKALSSKFLERRRFVVYLFLALLIFISWSLPCGEYLLSDTLNSSVLCVCGISVAFTVFSDMTYSDTFNYRQCLVYLLHIHCCQTLNFPLPSCWFVQGSLVQCMKRLSKNLVNANNKNSQQTLMPLYRIKTMFFMRFFHSAGLLVG